MESVNARELTAVIAERLEELGFRIQSSEPDGTGPSGAHSRPDLLASRAAGELRFVIEVKSRVPSRAQTLARAAREGAPSGHAIFAFPHVTAADAVRLRADGVNFIDSGGNTWVEAPGLTLWIEGRKPSYVRRAGVERPSRAFRPTGLRVVFSLLSAPRLQNAPLREIAAASGVSLGAVSNTLADLKETGAMGESRGRRLLSDVEKLRETWIEHYGATLRPTLEERRVEGPPPRWWSSSEAAVVLASTGMQLGGESALAVQGLRPEETVLYGSPPWRDVVRELRMPLAAQGRVLLRERFWDPGIVGGESTAPPLLILADAVASGDERQIEIARAGDRERARG